MFALPRLDLPGTVPNDEDFENLLRITKQYFDKRAQHLTTPKTQQIADTSFERARKDFFDGQRQS
jgi:hypothetical protein